MVRHLAVIWKQLNALLRLSSRVSDIIKSVSVAYKAQRIVCVLRGLDDGADCISSLLLLPKR